MIVAKSADWHSQNYGMAPEWHSQNYGMTTEYLGKMSHCLFFLWRGKCSLRSQNTEWLRTPTHGKLMIRRLLRHFPTSEIKSLLMMTSWAGGSCAKRARRPNYGIPTEWLGHRRSFHSSSVGFRLQCMAHDMSLARPDYIFEAPRVHFEKLLDSRNEEHIRIAFVFGNERVGMRHEDIVKCNVVLSILTNPVSIVNRVRKRTSE